MRLRIVIGLVLLCVACSKSGNSTAPVSETPAPADTQSSSAPSNDAQVAALLGELTQTVRRYAAERRQAPKDLQELVTAGYLPALPQAPPGKRFAVNKNLQVYLAN